MSDLLASLDEVMEVKVDEETKRTGAMIALVPSWEDLDRLHMGEDEDAEPIGELHTTILFMGKAADYEYDTRQRVIYAMREVAQDIVAPEARCFGIGMFNPAGEEPCIVANVGGNELVDVYNAIIEKISHMDLMQVPDQHQPWSPHITLAYTSDRNKVLDVMDKTGTVTFTGIRVAFGGIVEDIDFQQRGVTSDRGAREGERYEGKSDRLAKVKAPQKCKYCSQPATKSILHAEGRAYVPVCDTCLPKGRSAVGGSNAIDKIYDIEGKRLHPMNEIERMTALQIKEDATIRAELLSTKLITPGGRVGSDRKLGSRSNGENWVERTAGHLPQYIRIVRNGLMKEGMSEGRATGMAVAAMKRWARGGDNVRPKVQAAAAKALAQWEKMKASA